MKKQKYTARFFKDNLPEWKRKKDSLLVRYIFRPISFFTSSLAANCGIGANDVSYFSMLIAVAGSIFYCFGHRWTNIAGAFFIIFWMVLDCTDGNLARSVKKEPFGEFADGASSYILINTLFSALGVAVFKSGGLILIKGTWWICFLGAFTGGSDSLARLLFQKFENNKQEYENLKSKTDERQNPSRIVKLHDRIDKELGLNGIFLPAILICSIMNWLDIFVIFYAVFFICSLIATASLLIRRAQITEITI